MLAPLLALSIAAAPTFDVAPELEPQPAILREANAGWRDLAATWEQATHAPLPSPGTLRIVRGELHADEAGRSRVGVVELRQNKPGAVTESMVVALRHELAHQLLLAACPAASDDALFHEGFALATSGELSAWTDGPYLSMNAARSQLARARTLDSRDARLALARLLANWTDGAALPRPLATRLQRCADRAPWQPLTADELIAIPLADGDAEVVLSRHSGEVLRAEGDARVPLPFGSTLKPFFAAASLERAPKLAPELTRDDWKCGDAMPKQVDVGFALAHSCNGYFLDWGARDPGVVKLGAYGALLLRLGLAHLPTDASEAIGLRPTLKLSPIALAQAYRVLAASQPDVVTLLRATRTTGTLAELDASPRLAGFALKTGTVRDATSRVELGWIVAVDDDLVIVMARKGRMPRSFADALAELAAQFHGKREHARAEVQTFGLLDADDVEARCAGVPVVASSKGPSVPAAPSTKLADLARDGEALCLGAPWLVQLPGIAARPYAGSFRTSTPPALPPQPMVSERTRRAREGSRFIFTTRLLAYTAGVLAAEDAQLAGEPRAAMALTIAHNAGASRHPGRPVCDTTHCQAFQGTVKPEPGDAATLDADDPTPAGWLTFSQGGDEPWTETRPLAKVAQALGARPSNLAFASGTVRFDVRRQEGDAIFDDRAELPCERLRGPLQLPACPDRAEVGANEVRFSGHGRGHGEGLDVESAKRGALDRRALLERAYRPAAPAR